MLSNIIINIAMLRTGKHTCKQIMFNYGKKKPQVKRSKKKRVKNVVSKADGQNSITIGGYSILRRRMNSQRGLTCTIPQLSTYYIICKYC